MLGRILLLLHGKGYSEMGKRKKTDAINNGRLFIINQWETKKERGKTVLQVDLRKNI